MRTKKLRLKLKTKIALVYSLFVIAAGLGIVFYLNYALQESLNEKPILYKIAPGSYQVVIKALAKNKEVTGDSASIPFILQLNTSEFNNMLASEIFKRVEILSAFALLIIVLCAFITSYFLSKRLLGPVASIANEASKLDAANLDYRLKNDNTDDELKKLVGAFNHALHKIQSSFYDLEQFNAYATHELKNTIAIMRIQLEADRQKGDFEHALNFSLEHLDSITETVNNILAISSRQSEGNSEPVDLALAAAQAVDEYSVMNKNINLEVPEDGVSPVTGREIWFRQAISNLIDNAVKNAPEGSPIQVAVKQVFNAVIVSVADSGKGIEQEKLNDIWEPYYSTFSGKRSYGLGLAMVKHVTELCGGMVWAESSVGKGSTFYLSLPTDEDREIVLMRN